MTTTAWRFSGTEGADAAVPELIRSDLSVQQQDALRAAFSPRPPSEP
jgi:hypothetical protein